jgi:hypothetical protein
MTWAITTPTGDWKCGIKGTGKQYVPNRIILQLKKLKNSTQWRLSLANS